MKRDGKARAALGATNAGISIPGVNVTTAPVRIEEIRARAREIYVQRVASGATGDALSDWLQAEREVNLTACEQP